jgi:two-component system OmpR family response regulator
MHQLGRALMSKMVLLIEDEPNIIEAINFLLKRDGWEVKTHANCHDALDAIHRNKPDLIVLDVMLPGKSGYEILRDLRTEEDNKALPVLMLTARGQDKDRDLATQLGATRFMTKPFSNAELLSVVRAMMDP